MRTSLWKHQTRLLGFLTWLKYAIFRRPATGKIEVITMMYNEAFIAPLFVRHYAPWVDKITVFYNESPDGTRRELEETAAKCGFKGLDIIPFEFPNGFDDMIKIDQMNRAVRRSSADFAICVDADEFVYPWPFENANPREALAREKGNVITCEMFQSYRHTTDTDIDRTKPPLFQRRHGEAGIKDYAKPCVVRPRSGAQFARGCHSLLKHQKGTTVWRGVHWSKADHFCVLRCVRDRRDRFSENNWISNAGVQYRNINEEKLLAELKSHENDPELF